MRLVRYGELGGERPGLVDSEGSIRSLYPLISDWTADSLSSDVMTIVRAIDPFKLPRVSGAVRLGTPLKDFRQIVAVGLNYRDHATEARMDVPTLPLMFHKSIGSLSGPEDVIKIPHGATKVDWEVELGVVIGRNATNVAENDAGQYIIGYCLAMDISEREWQFNRGGLLNKGKSADSFTPVGPWILTSDEVTTPIAMSIWLKVNGAQRQSGNTSQMIFSVAQLVEHISHHQTLMAGELLLTGTPAGVGFGMTPPCYLTAGDKVTCGIDMLGTQRHEVVALE